MKRGSEYDELSVFSLSEQCASLADTQNQMLDAIARKMRPDPETGVSIDRRTVLSLQQQFTEIQTRLDAEFAAVRAVFAEAVNASRDLPPLPADVWQIIIELALGRRSLWRWAPGRAPLRLAPYLLPRLDDDAHYGSRLVHTLRLTCKSMCSLVDSRIVNTLVLPRRYRGKPTPAQYTKTARRLAQQFQCARFLRPDENLFVPSRPGGEYGSPMVLIGDYVRQSVHAISLEWSNRIARDAGFLPTFIVPNVAELRPALIVDHMALNYYDKKGFQSSVSQCPPRTGALTLAHGIWQGRFTYYTDLPDGVCAWSQTCTALARTRNNLPTPIDLCHYLYVYFVRLQDERDANHKNFTVTSLHRFLQQFVNLREIHYMDPLCNSSEDMARWCALHTLPRTYKSFLHLSCEDTEWGLLLQMTCAADSIAFDNKSYSDQRDRTGQFHWPQIA